MADVKGNKMLQTLYVIVNKIIFLLILYISSSVTFDISITFDIHIPSHTTIYDIYKYTY